jgi:hypothetical protein
MLVTSESLRWKLFRHWEAWVGFLAFGLCVYAGSDIGEHIGHDFVGTMIGGFTGLFVDNRVYDYVVQRYYRDKVFKSSL